MTRDKKLEHWHIVTLLLVIYDFIAIVGSYFLALWLRFDLRISLIEKVYLSTYFKTVFIYALIVILVFTMLRLYRSIWRFASYSELLRVIMATCITGVIYMLWLYVAEYRMPVSYFIFGLVLQFCFTLGVRFSYRFILLLRGRRKENTKVIKRVMLIGAGNAGQMILRDIRAAKEVTEEVYCFIDDNQNKWGRYIDNILVYGGRDLRGCT